MTSASAGYSRTIVNNCEQRCKRTVIKCSFPLTFILLWGTVGLGIIIWVAYGEDFSCQTQVPLLYTNSQCTFGSFLQICTISMAACPLLLIRDCETRRYTYFCKMLSGLARWLGILGVLFFTCSFFIGFYFIGSSCLSLQSEIFVSLIIASYSPLPLLIVFFFLSRCCCPFILQCFLFCFPSCIHYNINGVTVKYCSGEDKHIEEMCSICFDRFAKGDILGELPCGHTFHRDCICPWLNTKSTCPLCRIDVSATSSEA